MSIANVSSSAGTICTAPSIKFQQSASKCSRANSTPLKRVSTNHLDHVIAFQLGLSAKTLVKTSSPNNSISSVFARNRGYATYSVNWENMYGSSTQMAASPDVSLSATFNESTSWNSSVGGEPELWSSRFMDSPSMNSFMNTTKASSFLSSTDLFKRTMSLPNLRRQNEDEQLLRNSIPEVVNSDDSRISVGGRSSFATDRLQESPSPIQFADDSKDNIQDVKEFEEDVQDLMHTYDIISSLEAQYAPDSPNSKDMLSALKRLRRMPTVAKRILALRRRKGTAHNA